MNQAYLRCLENELFVSIFGQLRLQLQQPLHFMVDLQTRPPTSFNFKVRSKHEPADSIHQLWVKILERRAMGTKIEQTQGKACQRSTYLFMVPNCSSRATLSEHCSMTFAKSQRGKCRQTQRGHRWWRSQQEHGKVENIFVSRQQLCERQKEGPHAKQQSTLFFTQTFRRSLRVTSSENANQEQFPNLGEKLSTANHSCGDQLLDGCIDTNWSRAMNHEAFMVCT